MKSGGELSEGEGSKVSNRKNLIYGSILLCKSSAGGLVKKLLYFMVVCTIVTKYQYVTTFNNGHAKVKMICNGSVMTFVVTCIVMSLSQISRTLFFHVKTRSIKICR